MASNFRSASVILIGINVFFFFMQLTVDWFTEAFMLATSDILTRPWTLLTSMFLHGGPGHLMFNMYALLLFGTLIEQRIGWKRLLLLYFGSGILAGIGFVAFHELILGQSGAAVGASGGIMGILGMTIMLLPHLRVLFFFVIPMSMRTAGIVFAIIDLLGVFGLGIPGIANSAHLVGLAVGVGYGFQLLKTKKRFTRKFVYKRTPRRPSDAKKDKGIEMSDDDITEYLKNGRL